MIISQECVLFDCSTSLSLWFILEEIILCWMPLTSDERNSIIQAFRSEKQLLCNATATPLECKFTHSRNVPAHKHVQKSHKSRCHRSAHINVQNNVL